MIKEFLGHFLCESHPQSRHKDEQQKDETNDGQPVKPNTVFTAQGAKEII